MPHRKKQRYGPLQLIRDIALLPVIVVIWVVDRVMDNS